MSLHVNPELASHAVVGGIHYVLSIAASFNPLGHSDFTSSLVLILVLLMPQQTFRIESS